MVSTWKKKENNAILERIKLPENNSDNEEKGLDDFTVP